VIKKNIKSFKNEKEIFGFESNKNEKKNIFFVCTNLLFCTI